MFEFTNVMSAMNLNNEDTSQKKSKEEIVTTVKKSMPQEMIHECPSSKQNVCVQTTAVPIHKKPIKIDINDPIKWDVVLPQVWSLSDYDWERLKNHSLQANIQVIGSTKYKPVAGAVAGPNVDPEDRIFWYDLKFFSKKGRSILDTAVVNVPFCMNRSMPFQSNEVLQLPLDGSFFIQPSISDMSRCLNLNIQDWSIQLQISLTFK